MFPDPLLRYSGLDLPLPNPNGTFFSSLQLWSLEHVPKGNRMEPLERLLITMLWKCMQRKLSRTFGPSTLPWFSMLRPCWTGFVAWKTPTQAITDILMALQISMQLASQSVVNSWHARSSSLPQYLIFDTEFLTVPWRYVYNKRTINVLPYSFVRCFTFDQKLWEMIFSTLLILGSLPVISRFWMTLVTRVIMSRSLIPGLLGRWTSGSSSHTSFILGWLERLGSMALLAKGFFLGALWTHSQFVLLGFLGFHSLSFGTLHMLSSFALLLEML